MKSIALSVLAALAFWGAGCSNEGPAEQAGKKIDDAVESTQEAGQEALDDTADALDDAADAVSDAADDAAKKTKKAVE